MTFRRRYQYRQPVRARSGRGRNDEQEGFLLVTLLQSVLCVLMLCGAFVISGTMGMTEVKTALASLMTDETEAVEVFSPQIGEQAKRIKGIFELILQKAFPKKEESLGQGGMNPVGIAAQIPNGVTLFKPLLSSPMQKPVEGEVSSPFGYRLHPITGKPDWHTGVDWAVPLGSNVGAAWPGVVYETGSDNIYGNYAVIDHGGFMTKYCHCEAVLAKVGQRLRQGETVALSGSSGVSTGPHLHFELIVGGKCADPLSEALRWQTL